MTGQAFIDTLITAWNSREPQRILAFYHEDYRGYEASEAEELYGPESVAQMLDKFFHAFPDLKITPIEWAVDNGKVSVHWEACGTHRGRILNIPPTGKRITVTGASFLKLEKGRIIYGRHLWDMAAMLRAMGLLPALHNQNSIHN